MSSGSVLTGNVEKKKPFLRSVTEMDMPVLYSDTRCVPVKFNFMRGN